MSVNEIHAETTKSEVSVPEKEQMKPAYIHLEKGMTDYHLVELILKVDLYLQGRPPQIKVITDSWARDIRPYQTINSAKKLYIRAIEAGLLGCLMFHKYHQAAQEMYMIGYLKGKKKDDMLHFTGFNVSHYEETSRRSINVFHQLIKHVEADKSNVV